MGPTIWLKDSLSTCDLSREMEGPTELASFWERNYDAILFYLIVSAITLYDVYVVYISEKNGKKDVWVCSFSFFFFFFSFEKLDMLIRI